MHPLNFAPWRASGTVVGLLLNDPETLRSLGDAVQAAPYRGAPRAPVLQVKPRNTLQWLADGEPARIPLGSQPPGGPGWVLGAQFGLLVGRTACRVQPEQALAHLAGAALVAECVQATASHYRPGVAQRCRDASCCIALPRPLPRDLDDLTIALTLDGRPQPGAGMRGLLRGAAQALADVSAFMTLHPGDLLLLGAPAQAPAVRAGQTFTLACPGLGSLEGALA